MDTLTFALARELGAKGIRVNSILPDHTNTPLTKGNFDGKFGDGPVLCAPLPFGDLVTAWHSTGIANIAMYVHVSGEAFPEGDLAQLADGPDAAHRDAHRARAVAEVVGAYGEIARSRIETFNGYSFTPVAAVEAARRVMEGERQAGFETAARLFGGEFAESIAGTAITDEAVV